MLHVIIAGAGVGGLTAALALRQQGHRVTILEQSELNQETGAAIVLAPNCNGVLRRYGFIPEDHGATECLGWHLYTAQGRLVTEEKFARTDYASPYQLIHRQQLHQGLKALALDPTRPGQPAEINTSSRVVSVDATTATVHLQNGDSIHGDVVLGADGVHSVTRATVLEGCETKAAPFSAGKNCFRFLVPRAKLIADPVAKPVFEIMNHLCIWLAEDTRMVYYPCDDNATINFVAIHPAHLTDASLAAKDWQAKGSKDTLTAIYEHFGPEVKAVLNHVDPDKVRLYPLMDMQTLPRWTTGRLALLGDAAHPIMPHLGQGGAQAIEDGASLGVLLSASTKPSEIPARLRLYESARKDRASRIQEDTRLFGLNLSEFYKVKYDRLESRKMMFAFDEVVHSEGVLGAWVDSRELRDLEGEGEGEGENGVAGEEVDGNEKVNGLSGEVNGAPDGLEKSELKIDGGIVV